MINNYEKIVSLVSDTLVRAGSTFRNDKKCVYKNAIAEEDNLKAKWVLEQILENAEVAEANKSPLCDDSGIPHLVLDVGNNASIDGYTLDAIRDGIALGLRKLPGRPMGLVGNDLQRIDQSGGINPESDGVEPAPILIRRCNGDNLRLHILMFGGGPAIRAKTYRVFHKHNVSTVIDEIVEWATESTSLLGCTPCTIAVGVGRSHFEASSMMLEALVDGKYDKQSVLEKEITDRVNKSGVGSLGLGGKHTVLATFMKVGPQRSSGVRIVCMRPCCCFEPRIATIDLA